ncbi:uncharacterized protein LOC127131254 [Lathyrus oleraceus]|uniref:uncharacterized protein LOC127131254 n=1 Tax=Pisum sativum TaxID=3888 RepID=UPI0021D05CF2|nr:uncharacterized protein LOC127131254 [Pisum sativum]
MAAQNIQFQEKTRNNQRNTTTSIKSIEVQMRQITQQLAGSQAPGTLPSGTMINPREHNNVNVVITRMDELLEVDLEIRDHEKKQEEVVILPVVEEDKQKDLKPTIRLPYPQRTKKKKKKNEKNFKKFLEIFKKLEINIPFVEALEKMPLYTKFMKDIVSKKCPTNIEHVLLAETCSAILQGIKIPVKKKDRGSVTIPCTIRNRTFKKALIDLGFGDHSVKRPYGVVEDVMVKIGKFLFSVDFVILEMPEDEEIPLILGRPFLETGRCMIDIEEGTMTLKVYVEELKIDVRNTIKYKYDIGTSHTIEVINQVIAQSSPMKTPQLPLERVLSMSIFENDEEKDETESEVLAMMEAQPQWIRFKPHRWEDL